MLHKRLNTHILKEHICSRSQGDVNFLFLTDCTWFQISFSDQVHVVLEVREEETRLFVANGKRNNFPIAILLL